MSKLLKSAGLAALLLAAAVAPAQAALVERNLAGPHDHLLTLDTKTHLEWLDLTQTVGLSYDEALASPYVTDLGFRFATPDDLRTLALHADVLPGESQDNGLGVIELVGLFGCTDQCVKGWPAAQGWLDLGDPLMTGYSFFQYHHMPLEPGGPVYAFGDFTLNTVPFRSRTVSGGETGAFLIRDARGHIPEPSAWALMILGFGLTGATLRRRRGDMAPVPVTARAKPRRR